MFISFSCVTALQYVRAVVYQVYVRSRYGALDMGFHVLRREVRGTFIMPFFGDSFAAIRPLSSGSCWHVHPSGPLLIVDHRDILLVVCT